MFHIIFIELCVSISDFKFVLSNLLLRLLQKNLLITLKNPLKMIYKQKGLPKSIHQIFLNHYKSSKNASALML